MNAATVNRYEILEEAIKTSIGDDRIVTVEMPNDIEFDFIVGDLNQLAGDGVEVQSNVAEGKAVGSYMAAGSLLEVWGFRDEKPQDEMEWRVHVRFVEAD